MAKLQKNRPDQPTEQKQATKRIFSGTQKVVSDTFKLLNAQMHKNMGIDGKVPDIETFDHNHIFRTYNSDLKPNFEMKDGKCIGRTTPVGGHFHFVEFKFIKDQPVEIISISGPKKIVQRENRYGGYETVVVDVDAFLHDHHTHIADYRSSQEVEQRKINPLAAQLISEEAQKTASIDGVIG